MFQIDKYFVIKSYKDFLQNKGIAKNYDTDLSLNRKKSHSVYSVLTKVLEMYKLIRKFSLLQARKELIHDDPAFEKIKSILHTCIRNKIKTSSQGNLYININGNISFSGDVEEYENWIVNDKNKTVSLIRNIVDEFNKCFRGEEDPDKNKPLLNDENKEVNYIISNIPQEHIVMCAKGDFSAFNESFESLMIKIGVERSEWFEIMENIRNTIALTTNDNA